ncbi:unnamed protein product [Rhizoctonia solani]|uniref:Uncharacterized protein n=1 Tax=Rhizoctonia solani TaxID=456999 RepID=A0A8H3D4V9_9AGAM|nr:unnamed protein product [Rhizoctonia solani]CAE6507782.1 unnamed protein product [Rhizoctonia solani]
MANELLTPNQLLTALGSQANSVQQLNNNNNGLVHIFFLYPLTTGWSTQEVISINAKVYASHMIHKAELCRLVSELLPTICLQHCLEQIEHGDAPTLFLKVSGTLEGGSAIASYHSWTNTWDLHPGIVPLPEDHKVVIKLDTTDSAVPGPQALVNMMHSAGPGTSGSFLSPPLSQLNLGAVSPAGSSVQLQDQPDGGTTPVAQSSIPSWNILSPILSRRISSFRAAHPKNQDELHEIWKNLIPGLINASRGKVQKKFSSTHVQQLLDHVRYLPVPSSPPSKEMQDLHAHVPKSQIIADRTILEWQCVSLWYHQLTNEEKEHKQDTFFNGRGKWLRTAKAWLNELPSASGTVQMMEGAQAGQEVGSALGLSTDLIDIEDD